MTDPIHFEPVTDIVGVEFYEYQVHVHEDARTWWDLAGNPGLLFFELHEISGRFTAPPELAGQPVFGSGDSKPGEPDLAGEITWEGELFLDNERVTQVMHDDIDARLQAIATALKRVAAIAATAMPEIAESRARAARTSTPGRIV